MTQAEKSNAAWRIVCLEDGRGNPSAMARVSGISRQTIYTMQRATPGNV
jgi:transcriptional regulator of acetoin/glycerol metabolism